MIKRSSKILLLLPEVFGCAGGIQMFCRALCMAAGRWAQKNDASVRAIVLNDKVDPDPRYVNGGFASYTGSGKSKGKFVTSYLRAIAAHPPDLIVIGHVSLAPLALLPKFLGRSTRTSIITYGVEVWRSLSAAEREAMQRADAVLAISDYTRGEILKRNPIPAEKIKLFPCSLDPFWVADCRPPAVSHPPALLTVSRMEKGDSYKGVDRVIESLPAVVREVGPVNYTVVGRGSDVPRLQSLAAELGVSRYVTFTGGVSDEALREYYRNCSLFVMPSEKEGFGIVFLEAMAYAKPVIGGAHGGTVSVVEDGKTGILVNRRDRHALSQAIITILKNEQLRLEYGQAGYDRLVNEFSFGKFESNLDSFLRSCIHG